MYFVMNLQELHTARDLFCGNHDTAENAPVM